jgi:hypothetical protein
MIMIMCGGSVSCQPHTKLAGPCSGTAAVEMLFAAVLALLQQCLHCCSSACIAAEMVDQAAAQCWWWHSRLAGAAVV